MLLDMLGHCDDIIVNMKIARILDINTAVYLSVIIDINHKAIVKNKLKSGKYFELDRGYVRTRTTLGKEAQINCDVMLMSLNIIEKADENLIYINDEVLISLLSNMKRGDVKAIKSKVAIDLEMYKDKKKSDSRQSTIDRLMSYVSYKDDELRLGMRGWIDSISHRFGIRTVSNQLIAEFESKLNNYTHGDLDMALKIIDIATSQSYKEVQWAINVYEAENKSCRSKSDVRTTQQRVATLSTIKHDIEF